MIPKKRHGSEDAQHEPVEKLYTASDLARFCQVDLKTIHNWEGQGKIASSRTPGRHLRFRATVVKAFLARWGYPIPAELREVEAAKEFEGVPDPERLTAKQREAVEAWRALPEDERSAMKRCVNLGSVNLGQRESVAIDLLAAFEPSSS